ncbi:hypothetical protein Dvina_23165 [Dactylosporangium vinaceum]|uniref:Uncharacterized protein n=1 Tax=Dactylosporangium vinaceum TaxID=53362 RepID=A0ABV5MCP9_9ACTN|nr:hypothetical protein [Dactylosporangium vinaceum]UAC02488.1 hypothetical protein Dvina_23165 [Dactylosporangium vinaceum]
MTEQKTATAPDRRYRRSATGRGGGGAVYGLGFIGALVYYIQQAGGFWVGVLGVLKALVWPAFLVYDVLKHLAG